MAGGRGFTLLEMVVVLAILSIITAVTVPSLYTVYHNQRLATAAVKMAADIRYLQQRAMTEEDEFRIQFYPEIGGPLDNQYRLRGKRMLSVIKKVQLPIGVELWNMGTTFGNDQQLSIDAKGLPNNSGRVILQSKYTGKIKVIVIFNITGRVRVEWYPSP